MNWATVNFGKHAGKTLPQIIFDDPDWFFWAYENNAFKGGLTRETARSTAGLASIRVPRARGQSDAGGVSVPFISPMENLERCI